jgi:hypothetical protein
MVKVNRWFNRRRKVVWEEPGLPPFVKINPNSPPGAAEGGLQPGDMSMAAAAEEFLEIDEDETPELGTDEPGLQGIPADKRA